MPRHDKSQTARDLENFLQDFQLSDFDLFTTTGQSDLITERSEYAAQG